MDCYAFVFRSYITKEVKGPDVNVARSDLTLMVETAESARIKLYKQLEVHVGVVCSMSDIKMSRVMRKPIFA